jgi:hypothetical protein
MLDNNNFGFWGGGSGGGGGGGGTVTSVGLCMPPAFAVSNSPITTAGNLCVQGAGLASQYIRGDGTLGDFPDVGGGAGSQIFYFNGGVSQGTIGGQASFQMSKVANVGAAADFPIIGNGLMAQFITDIGSPNQLLIPAGAWQFSTYLSSSNNSGTPQVYAVISKWDGTTLTTIATSANEFITNGTAVDLYNFTASLPDTVLLATDRIVVTFYTTNTGGRTITLYTQSTNLSDVTTTFPNGISSLNGLTANTQFFQTTTCGTDFGIVSSGNTHCFNLPTASCTNRGALSSADYCRFYNASGAAPALTYDSIGAANIKPICGTNTYNCIFALAYNNINGGNFNLIGNFGITPINPTPQPAGEGQGIACFNTISGGCCNKICGTTLASGNPNFQPNQNICRNFIGGGACNSITWIQFDSSIVGGFGNTISGCTFDNSFTWNRANIIGGGCLNTISPSGNFQVFNSGIFSGQSNYVGGHYSFIGGGIANSIYSSFGASALSVIVGGNSNCTFSEYNAILGGFNNNVSNNYGVILGGQCNTVTGCYAGVANLCGVNASADCTFYFCNLCVLGTISGGGGGISSLNGLTASTQTFQVTTACTDFTITSSGSTHCFNLPTASCTNRGALSSADYCLFYNNVLCSPYIKDAQSNIRATNQDIAFFCSSFATISGGRQNQINYDTGQFIGGGCNNQIVFGSFNNTVGGCRNCVLSTGGVSNYTFIGGGSSHLIRAASNYGAIVNGSGNCLINAPYGAILNGNANFVSNSYGIILGGECNTVTGCYAGAFGCGINASVANTFYFCHLCLLGDFRNGGSVQLAGIANSVAGGNILYFDNTTKCVAFGGLTSGTAAPTGGVDGDIYLQYV